MSNEDTGKSRWNGRIFLLELLQKSINATQKSFISITLNLHGSVVSGKMIGMKVYYEGLRKLFIERAISERDQDNFDNKKMLNEVFEEIIKATKEAMEKDVPYNYIFLKDALIYVGNQPLTFTGGYWNGKIDSIDGFILGADFEQKNTY
jgi:hypothetical protein